MLIDEGHEFAVDLGLEYLLDDRHHLGCRDAQAAPELARDTARGEFGRDLRPSAVHDHRLHACVPQVDHVFGEGTLELVVDHGVAAELDDDDLALEPLQPRQRLDEHGGLHGRIQVPRIVAHELYALFSCT